MNKKVSILWETQALLQDSGEEDANCIFILLFYKDFLFHRAADFACFNVSLEVFNYLKRPKLFNFDARWSFRKKENLRELRVR